MRGIRGTVGIVALLSIAACGSEPRSPLILDGNPADKVLGLRELTTPQSEELRGVITSAGESCTGIERAYLNEVNVARGREAWAVRCAEGSYAVQIASDGSSSNVYRCRERSFDDIPCVQGNAGYRYGAREPQSSAPLNPELGKLLESMTSKDGKATEGGR
jgi:hypothetical protein